MNEERSTPIHVIETVEVPPEAVAHIAHEKASEAVAKTSSLDEKLDAIHDEVRGLRTEVSTVAQKSHEHAVVAANESEQAEGAKTEAKELVIEPVHDVATHVQKKAAHKQTRGRRGKRRT